MGRTAGAYGDDAVSKHLLGAIQWAAGMVRGNCKATINSNYTRRRAQREPGGTGPRPPGDT